MRITLACAIAVSLLGTEACAQSLESDEAAKAIALTRETKATYSIYIWNVITRPGIATEEEWSAEFHDGSLHRVETPRDRIIADCVAQTGVYLQISTGEITRGSQVARVACGIQANSQILEARVIGRDNGEFGSTIRVLVRDPENIRTYDIAESGALVAATIDDLESNHLLKGRAFHLFDSVPAGIFSEESLKQSAVSEQYRSRPAAQSSTD